jgi:hypothetical protein
MERSLAGVMRPYKPVTPAKKAPVVAREQIERSSPFARREQSDSPRGFDAINLAAV